MTRHLLPALFGLALLGVGMLAVRQGAQLAELRDELRALRQSLAAAPAVHAPRPLAAPPPQTRPLPVPVREPRAAEPLPAAPRAAVSADEVARVESAVLSLLEADRPELRAKLRAVVQEHQESAEREQHEQRRERWIARTEARLAELKGDAALSTEQRDAIVNVLLATRDQITDLRRSAETGQDFLATRDRTRLLRSEADTQIRALLSGPQYEAYIQLMERDDDDERPRGRGPRASN